MKTVLASASPRRRELLGLIVKEFDVIPSDCEEIITKTKPEEIVKELAELKAADVAEKIAPKCVPASTGFDGTQQQVRVIGSDTIVVFEEQILGKPKDEADALRMLTLLQGNTHQVYTGVCVIDLLPSGEKIQKVFAEKTDVTMFPVSQEELLKYIDTKESMDKAGAYAVQGISAKFIEKICGDYHNVVGLPVGRLYQECYK